MKFPPVKMTYKIQVPSHMKIAFKFVVTIQYESNNDRWVDILCECGTIVMQNVLPNVSVRDLACSLAAGKLCESRKCGFCLAFLHKTGVVCTFSS